jgi:proteasome lid subunit RPN8/RPN11
LKERNDKERESRDLGVTIIDTESLISVRQTCPPLLAQGNLTSVGSPEDERLQILVGPDAFSAINTYAASDLSRELGGFLIGCPYEWKGRTYVEIIDALPGEQTSSGAVHLTISHDTWVRAQAMVRAKFPGMHIVGWYHTHPRMYVFMSSRDIAIHEGFFREPWHVSLVIEPSRREAGFFVWGEDDVQRAHGYHIAYPEDTPTEEYWQPARPIDADLDVSPPTLDEFYEVGCWRTRWVEQDEIAVKVRQEVIDLIHRQAVSRPMPIFGFCLGRVRSNVGEEGPYFFVEVIDVQPVLDQHLVENLSSQSTADIKRKLIDSMQGDDRLRLVGGYWLQSRSKPWLHTLYKRIHKKVFPSLWQIALVGDLEQGVESCVWRGTDGKFVTHQLVEMVALEELSGDGLERTLATIRDACQAILLHSTRINEGEDSSRD